MGLRVAEEQVVDFLLVHTQALALVGADELEELHQLGLALSIELLSGCYS